MQYTLITKTGLVMQFYIQGVADMYQRIYGGVVVTPAALATEVQPATIS